MWSGRQGPQKKQGFCPIHLFGGRGAKKQDFLPDLADFDAAYAQKFEAGRFTLIVSNVGSHDGTSRMLSWLGRSKCVTPLRPSALSYQIARIIPTTTPR
jgi:hypothetical protein